MRCWTVHHHESTGSLTISSYVRTPTLDLGSGQSGCHSWRTVEGRLVDVDQTVGETGTYGDLLKMLTRARYAAHSSPAALADTLRPWSQKSAHVREYD